MELEKLADLVAQFAPEHFRDICSALSKLYEELDGAKAVLTNTYTFASAHDNFTLIRDIAGAQEELFRKMEGIQGVLDILQGYSESAGATNSLVAGKDSTYERRFPKKAGTELTKGGKVAIGVGRAGYITKEDDGQDSGEDGNNIKMPGILHGADEGTPYSPDDSKTDGKVHAHETVGHALRAARLDSCPNGIEMNTEAISLDNYSISLINRKPAGFSFGNHFYKVKSWKEVLLFTCEIVYESHSEIFRKIIDNEDFPGRKYVFASKKDDLRQPAKIPHADFWIHTKLGSEEIRSIINELLDRCNINGKAMKLYLFEK